MNNDCLSPDDHGELPDDFEQRNREENLFGATSHRYSIPPCGIDGVEPTVALAAATHLPEMHRGKPLRHRFAVVRKYVTHGDLGAVRADGQPYRSAAQHRLNNAINDVASDADLSTSTIRDACAKAYKESDVVESGEFESAMAAFRADCQAILEAVRSEG